MNIKRGMRQGCVMSPLLFNAYSESIFEEALLSENGRIIINGKDIKNIRFEFKIEKVQKYKYLSTWITENNEQTEMRTRIETARNAFVKLKTILVPRPNNGTGKLDT